MSLSAFINRRENPKEFFINQLMFIAVGVGVGGALYLMQVTLVAKKELLFGSGLLTVAVLGGLFILMTAAVAASCISQVRRLHDADKPAWIMWLLLLISCIPYISVLGILGVVVIFRLPGTKGPNRYGDESNCKYFWDRQTVKRKKQSELSTH